MTYENITLETVILICFAVAVIIGGILFVLKVERDTPVVKDDEEEPPLGI